MFTDVSCQNVYRCFLSKCLQMFLVKMFTDVSCQNVYRLFLVKIKCGCCGFVSLGFLVLALHCHTFEGLTKEGMFAASCSLTETNRN